MENFIGDRIRELREKKHISQFAMAFHLGMSQAAYSKIERGLTEIKASHLYAIAGVLNTSIYELLPPSLGAGTLNRNEYLLQPVFLSLKSLISRLILRNKKR